MAVKKIKKSKSTRKSRTFHMDEKLHHKLVVQAAKLGIRPVRLLERVLAQKLARRVA